MVWAVAPVYGQSLRERVFGISNGVVRMTYPARDGVCAGDTYTGPAHSHRRDEIQDPLANIDPPEWNNGCAHEQVHTAVQLQDGHVVSVRWYAGGAWGPATSDTKDLGAVNAVDAAKMLLDAVDSVNLQIQWQALGAAVVANGADVIGTLTNTVADQRRAVAVRQWALTAITRRPRTQWREMIGRIAADRGEPTPLRETATSLLSATESLWERDMLIKIATGSDAPTVRQIAVQNLAPVNDPSVLALMERIAGGQ